VIFVYRQNGRWGSVARSRDPGLHGRRPVFATPRALALSYFDPYVDFTAASPGTRSFDLATAMGDYDWRVAATNVWKVERVLLDFPALGRSDPRMPAWPDCARGTAHFGRGTAEPIEYRGRERWTPLPSEFRD
jgi:hypothetical protein